MEKQTAVTEKQNLSFINKIKDGTVIGYKYFAFDHTDQIMLELRGNFTGTVTLSTDAEGIIIIGSARIHSPGEIWTIIPIKLSEVSGKQALYMIFHGDGLLDMKSFSFPGR